MQSLEEFSDEVKVAYRAFQDMNSSKTAHFNCLKAIENIYEAGGAPSITEKLELEKLLANHDKNVLAFKTATDAVKDGDEKKSLIQLMS